MPVPEWIARVQVVLDKQLPFGTWVRSIYPAILRLDAAVKLMLLVASGTGRQVGTCVWHGQSLDSVMSDPSRWSWSSRFRLTLPIVL